MTKCQVGEVVLDTSPVVTTPDGGGLYEEYHSAMFLDTVGRPSYHESLRMFPESASLQSANAATQKVASERRLVRRYPYAPLTQSNVDQVVFGENIDSGIYMDYIDLHGGAAGHPSWVERPKGLRTNITRRRQREMKLRRTGRELLARLLGPRDSNKAFAHIAPNVSRTQNLF